MTKNSLKKLIFAVFNSIAEYNSNKSTVSSAFSLIPFNADFMRAMGVQYSMGETGYISFGPLFGNLIIQWGTATSHNTDHVTINFPISYSANCYYVNIINESSDADLDSYSELRITSLSRTSANITDYFMNNTGGLKRWIAIGV